MPIQKSRCLRQGLSQGCRRAAGRNGEGRALPKWPPPDWTRLLATTCRNRTSRGDRVDALRAGPGAVWSYAGERVVPRK